MKKNIYLVQVSAVYGESVKTAYLPYACGCLAAYAFGHEEIKRNYRLGDFIFIRENTDKVVASLENPFLVGFSCYIWNMEYNKVLARKIKRKFPEAIIVFGGHNVKPNGEDLNDLPYVDYIMHGEGEIGFYKLLTAFMNKGPVSLVPGISFRTEQKIVTNPTETAADLSDFPSPYTEGYFDGIIQKSGISPSVVWETNRGCPNRCAFCDWGALKARVRMFSEERINAELDWMVKNKVEYVYCADANFGLFERDSRIADKIIELKNTYGYPQVFKTNYTKNKDDVVFSVSQRLMHEKIGKSPTLSFQSLSPEVLKIIGRSNMELDHFKNLMAKYAKAHTAVYSELILGLPGETYDSFVNGIDTLLSCNQHTAIGIYPCELLPNSLLGSGEYREKYRIRAVKTDFTQYHVLPCQDDVQEYSHIIISTASMEQEDWKRAFLFSVCVQALHNLGLTRAFAIYVNKELNISYRHFYEGLIAYLEGLSPDTVGGSVYRTVSEGTNGIVNGTQSFAMVYGEQEKLTWSFEEYMYLALLKNEKEFYAEILPYLKALFSQSEVFEELLTYQRGILKKPGQSGMKMKLSYDFYTYFQNVYADTYTPLQRKANRLCVQDKCYDNYDEFCRIHVWYGRRDDAQLYTGKRNTPVIITKE